MRLARFFLPALLLGLSGCATYTTPGGPASIPEITDRPIAELLAREPAASFPVALIPARIQAPDYRASSNQSVGGGSYRVVMTRDVETEADFERLAAMPGVRAVGALNRVLLGSSYRDAEDLRKAAAQLRGDVLLIYTVDTSFYTETDRIGPLQALSLGFFPNRKSFVTATWSAAFVDVRTGFVYGTAEASAREDQRASLWGTKAAIENARLAAERTAFPLLVDEIETAWADVVGEYASP